jgi:hypothetical protein
MFRAFLCPSSEAYQLQQQPLVYRRNLEVAVLLAVVGPVDSFECVGMHGPTNPKYFEEVCISCSKFVFLFTLLKKSKSF